MKPYCMCERKNGKMCTRYAKYNLESFPVCGTHLNLLKKQEDCAVCLDVLSASKNIKLSCGHWFHVNCLLGCMKRECPLCRTKMTPDDCCAVFDEKLVKPLVKEIFAKTDEQQPMLFDGISTLLAIHNKSEWLCKNTRYIHHKLYNTSLDETKLFIVLRIFDALLTHMEDFNTLTNFDTEKWFLGVCRDTAS